LTEGRIMPVMSDVTQLIAAPAVLRAAIAGLFHPKDQKFKVTAKGGERGRRFVEWSMLRTFLILLMLTLLGVISYFKSGIGPDHPSASVLALFWTWYNIVILIIACCVCIEQPRKRKAERFEMAEQAMVVTKDSASSFGVTDISVSGAGFIGKAPAGPGEMVLVALASCTVKATVARSGAGFFAVRFDDTLAVRVALVRHIYSGRSMRAFREIRWPSVLRAVGTRLFN
jgi:cellulose synthase (UDP-forming)